MPDPTKDNNKGKNNNKDISLEDRLNEASQSFISSLSKGTLVPSNNNIGLSEPSFGESKYDKDVPIPTVEYGNLNEIRAQRQGALSKWANGITKATGIAGTSILENTAGLVYGLADAAISGDISKTYNNDFTKSLDSFNDYIKDNMPNYHIKAEQDYNLLQKLGTSNFWSEQFLSGAAYMGAAVATGAGLNKFTSLAKLVRAGKTIDEVALATKGWSELDNAARGIRIADAIDFGKNAALMSHGESAIEARETYNSTKEQLIKDYQTKFKVEPNEEVLKDIETQAKAAGNWGYATNLAITGVTNALLFPKMLSKGYTANKLDLNDINKLEGVYSQEARSIRKSTLKGILEGSIEEGGQELGQLLSQKTLTDYYGQAYKDKKDQHGFIQSLLNGLQQTLGSEEGLENFFLGALMGGPAKAVQSRKEAKIINDRSQTIVDLLNNPQIQKVVNTFDNYVRSTNYEKAKDQALKQGSKFNYLNAEFDQNKSIVKQFIDNGGKDLLIQQYKDMIGMEEEEFKKVAGYDINKPLSKSQSEIVNNTIKLIETLDKTNNTIKELFPYNPRIHDNYNNYNALTTNLWHYSTSIDNMNKRIHEINNDVYKIAMDKSVELLGDGTNENPFSIKDNPLLAQYINEANQDLEKARDYKEALIESYKLLSDPKTLRSTLSKIKEEAEKQGKESEKEILKVNKEEKIQEFKESNPEKIVNPFEGADSSESGNIIVEDPIQVKNDHNDKIHSIEMNYRNELNQLEQIKSENPEVDITEDISKAKVKYDKELEDLNKESETKEDIILNSEDGIVPDLTNKDKSNIEEQLKESLVFVTSDDKEYSPQGRTIRIGNLIVNAANSIAYLSKKYTEDIILNRKQNKIELNDVDDNLNDRMQEPMLLSSTQYQVGDELTIEVDKLFNILLDNGTNLSYEQHKNDPLKVPMKIINKDKKTIGYLHDIDWITEENVANNNGNVEYQRKLLTQLRYSIFEKGSKDVIIDNKTFGILSTTVDDKDKTTSELIKNNNIKFAIGKNNQFWTGLEDILTGEQPVNNSIQSGMTYMIVNTPVRGKTVALPLFNTKVNETTIDTLVNAVEAFYSKNEAIANEVLKYTDHDILTVKGLRDFFNLFVSTNKFSQDDLNANTGRDDKLFIDIAGSGIKYGTGGNILTEVGSPQYWNKDEFRDNIKNAYASIFLKHLNNPNFKLANIDNEGKVTPKEITYNEYIKEITTTNIVEHKLPDNSYTYFVQPVITFSDKVDSQKLIDEHKVEEVLEETKIANIEEDEDLPTELGKIDLDDLQLNDNEDYLPSISKDEISYRLKAVKALQSDKVRKPKKDNLLGFYNDLIKQGITKEQLEIVKELYKDDMTKDQLITELLSSMTYTIKIETSKYNRNFDEDKYGDYENQPERGEFTNYYGNLTVPGGTNYTENEIKTPNIVPSIKGHAQFSSNNGIGWFRGDDKIIEGISKNMQKRDSENNIVEPNIESFTHYQDNNKTKWKVSYIHPTKFFQIEIFEDKNLAEDFFNKIKSKFNLLTTQTKTRRILEVQSDLFQKGRDKNDLTTLNQPTIGEFNVEDNQHEPDFDNVENIKTDIKGNKFLQLLNKDNNWVTFFVKSIIQDSTKKGYEKVLFPKGDTASKIEGHQSLEEFKKEKSFQLDKQQKKIDKLNSGKLIDYYYQNGNNSRTLLELPDGTYYDAKISNDIPLGIFFPNTKEEGKEAVQKLIDRLQVEVNQLKQELETVEREGFAALKPIYKFYEETVGNILKKQGYNPNIITDEYNNKWYEIKLESKFEETIDLLPIKLEQTQIDNIAKESSLIEGFNAYQQTQVINIMNSYILKNLKDVNEKGVKRDELYENLKSIFNKYAKAYYSLSNNKSKSELDRDKANFLSKEFTKILKNFDLFKLQSIEKLKLFSVKETNVEGNIGYEDLESNNEKINFDDGATFQIDPKDGMSGRLKQFLSFIPNVKPSYIVLESYLPFDEVTNYLSGQLTGLDASYIDISAKLDELVPYHKWIKDVKTLLDNSSEEIRNEFIVWATKHDTNFKYIEIEGKNKGIKSFKVVDSDQNSIIKTILNKWLTNMKISSLVKESTPGNLIIDNEQRTKLLQEFKSININDLEAIREWLNKIGVDISLVSLDNLKTKLDKSWDKEFTQAGGVFKVIVDKLGSLSKESINEDEDTFDSNNPLLDNSGIRKLAEIESLVSDNNYSNSHKSGEGKTRYSYTNNNYFIKQFYKLKHNKSNYLEQLGKISFSSTSSWLNKLKNPNGYFRQTFSYFRPDTLNADKNNAVTIDKMSSRELEITKLGLFQNQNNGSKDKGLISNFIFLTNSDKSVPIGITALRENISISFNNNDYTISSSTIDSIYNIVDGEYKRIRNSYNINNNIDRYAPNRFYFFEELNDNEILWNIDGNKRTLKQLDDNIKSEIKRILEDHLRNLVKDKIEHWDSLGITNDKNIGFFDKDYIKDIQSRIREKDINNKNIVTYSTIDYVTNYLISNSNFFQLFVSDPAQFWKKNMEETWIDIGKRLAGEIAPGIELADSKNNKYKQSFLKDTSGVLAISKNYNQIVKLIGEEAAKPYKEIEGTDAQEWTTLNEHLYVLNKLGRISQDEVNSLLEREERGKLDINDYKNIFQPIKPVYVNTQLEPGTDINRKIYIKSSSFPLVKGLSPDLDKLRKSMLKHGIDRLAFKSATKVGGPKDYIEIFDKEGNILDNVDLSSNSIELNRDGFRIQQDVPFDKDKSEINRGTQESKLLFANILGLDKFNYNSEELNGKQLYEKYNELNKELFESSRKELLKELYIPNTFVLDMIKVQDILVKEAISKEWSSNDISTLSLIQEDEIKQSFSLPLWSSPQASKVEALLNSLVDNRVRKQKMRGNSFVLGTEEGFKGNSKDIIYTLDYDPTVGLLPQRLDKNTGKVLPAQVLIANKLRDENGILIDLKDYINNEGYLDTTKINPEVLKLFGFRIPTQGHSSMSYIEIVGFLPSYMGDLIIAPKDFTKQMGSDFDIDKLYTYFYETKVNNGYLIKIDNNKNKILDIHLSILSHPKVLEQVLQPLGFGRLPELAKRVDKARNNRFKTNFKATRLSDTYQKEKYLKARAGKNGVGVKSLDSVFTAISQDKSLYLRTIDGEGNDIKLNLVFGDENNKPIELNDISNELSINKEPKIYTVAAYQSAAVDNEKEQLLEKINSNNYTFDTERALSAVGFTEDFIVSLTSQDIIFEYVDLMSRTQDSINEEFISRPEDTIIDELIDKYSKEGGFSSDILNSLLDTDYPLSEKEMWDSIEHGLNDSNYYKTQIRSLIKFNKAREIGKEISNIELTINTDSSGISPSLIESTYKETKVNNLKDNKYIANVTNLLDNTINGYATENALKVNNKLWSRFFPYNKEKVLYLFNEVQRITGKEILTNEQRVKIFNEMKSFIYSKQDLGLDNEEIQSLRKKLFFDTKDNKSLATRVKELQKTSKNSFIIRLIVQSDKTGNKPSLIKYNASAAENYDELSVYQGFTDLLVNPNTREIGQDLITYFYLSGGIQQAIQFGKYIPISYLNNIPFSKNLRDINFNDETLFGIDNKEKYYDTSNFTKQYIQHNPNQAIKLNNDLSQVDKPKYDKFKRLVSFTINFEKNPNLLVSRNNPLTGDSFMGLPEFVSIFNDKSKKGFKRFDLFQYVGDGKYIKIDILGTFGYNEYNQNSNNIKSLVKYNQANIEVPVKSIKTDNRDSLEKDQEINLVDNNQVKTDRYKDYIQGKSISEILNKISNSPNKYNAELAKWINKLLDNQSSIKFELTNRDTRGLYDYNTSTIKINPNNINSNDEFETVILHEYIHYLTGHTINNPKTKEQQKVVDSLKTLQGLLIKKVNSNSEWKKSYEEFVSKYQAKQGIDEAEISKNYGAYKLTEFVTMALTDIEFQKILNDIPFNESKSILDRFKDIIKNLLSTLGFPINENSVLSKAISDSLELATLNNSEYVESKIEDKLPSKDNTRDIIKQQILDTIGLNNTSAKLIKPNTILLPFSDRHKTKQSTYKWAEYIKNKLDKQFEANKFNSVVQIDTNDSRGTLLHIVIPTKLVDSRSNEDYLPVNNKTIKYQKEINKIQDRINFINKVIASNKSNRELISDLKAKVKTLKNRIDQIKEEDKLVDIISYGNNDIKELETLLNKDKISPTDLFYSNKIIYQWKNSLGSIFKESDLRKNSEGNTSSNVQAIESIIKEINRLELKYDKIFENIVQDVYKDQGFKLTKEQIFAAKKEIGSLTANLRDVNMAEDHTLQLIGKIIKSAAFDTEQELGKEFNIIDNLFDKIKKNPLYKALGFKLFTQESKDGKTGNLVSRFSDEFYKESARLREVAKKVGAKGWEAYFKWKRENTIIFDLRKLFYNEYQQIAGKYKYSEKEITDHITDLKKQLGEKGYNRYYNSLKEKLELYKQDLEANKDRIETLEADDAEKASMLNEWKLENSPFVYAETVYDGVKNKIGNKFINPKGYKYTSEVPRRFTKDGKTTNWYDSKFDKIEANEDLYNFYNYVIDKNNELYNYMPDYVVEDLQHNYLPEMHKNIIEQFSDKGMYKGLIGWYDKVVNELTTNDISNVSYKERDPNTGKLIKTLPIKMLGNKLNPEDKSYDLLAVTKAFMITGVAYKHKSKVEDSIRVTQELINKAVEKQENAKREHLLDAQGNPINTTDSLKNYKILSDYAIDAGFYGNRKAIEGVSKTKKLLTSEEISKKKELKKELEDPKITEERKTEVKQEIKNLGANIVGSSVWDKLLQFVQLKGMGWNLFAPTNNVAFAFISNAIHAAGGEDFNLNDFFWAQAMMLHSVGKSVSLDTLSSKEATKINSLMNLYNVVGETDQAAYASTAFNNNVGKGLQKLSPLELTNRAEYLNQGVTFLAMMKATKVIDLKGNERSLWEAYNEKGEWKTNEFGGKPEWTSSKEKMKEFKFRLEQIKKSIHGNYDPNSPVNIKKTVMGRAIMMFRSWVTEGFATRFEKETSDELLGRVRKGRFRTYNILTGGDIGHLKGTPLLLAQMANFLTFGATFKTSLDQLSKVDKANMRKNAAEIMIYTSLYLLVLSMKHAMSDDDEEKHALTALVNIGFRVQNDMAFFTSPLAFEKITQSSIPAMSVVTDIAKFVKAAQETIAGNGTYKRGIYKGQSKIKISLARNFPGSTQVVRTIGGLNIVDER